jgi:hypothetical protein
MSDRTHPNRLEKKKNMLITSKSGVAGRRLGLRSLHELGNGIAVLLKTCRTRQTENELAVRGIKPPDGKG